jgi:hypothetical protein
MEGVAAKASDQLLALGLPGVLILALLWICWRLFNLYVDGQEKRIDEGKQTAAALTSNTNALERLTDVIKERAK